MATVNQCAASLARLTLCSTARPTVISAPKSLSLLPISQRRWKSGQNMGMQARSREKEKLRKKKKMQRHREYKYAVVSKEEQFSLCDAMRYLRASEVGRPPSSATYELALKLRTPKNSAVIRDRIRLPYPVKSDTRIAVICKEGSGAMSEAKNAGAVAFGEESLFAVIKANPNNLPFNRLICHTDSEPALKKAGLGRILGPKGLMPSIKTNTITKSIVSMMHEMVGAENYREKIGAIRMPIGNIQFTPKQLSENIKTMVTSVKQNIHNLDDRGIVSKDLIEVVLSSTSGPGFPLSGAFASTDNDVTAAHLSMTM
ncbi:50S ribosomal protein L1 [Nemania sp. FL0916]|nr:50S ribosomal protein L1 [Nemania sp. FL0916]